MKWLPCLTSLAGIASACAIGLGYAGEPDLQPAADYSSWAVNPTVPGPDLPPVGRSLFDYLVSERAGDAKAYHVPFPFSALIERIQAHLSQREFNGGTRVVLIPMGRSLQRVAAAPDFFKYPVCFHFLEDFSEG